MKKETEPTTELRASSDEPQLRINQRYAKLRLKEKDEHVYMLKRRSKVLQVKDEDYRSKTIQHEKKIRRHQEIQQGIKNDRQQMSQLAQKKMSSIEANRIKNLEYKKKIEQNIKNMQQSIKTERTYEYQASKKNSKKNEALILEKKKQNYQELQDRRKRINQDEQDQRESISRFRDYHRNETINKKVEDSEHLLELAKKREKQMQELQKTEKQLLEKASHSIQISQQMREKMRKIMGDQRRFTKLPSISRRSHGGSTSITLIQGSY